MGDKARFVVRELFRIALIGGLIISAFALGILKSTKTHLIARQEQAECFTHIVKKIEEKTYSENSSYASLFKEADTGKRDLNLILMFSEVWSQPCNFPDRWFKEPLGVAPEEAKKKTLENFIAGIQLGEKESDMVRKAVLLLFAGAVLLGLFLVKTAISIVLHLKRQEGEIS